MLAKLLMTGGMHFPYFYVCELGWRVLSNPSHKHYRNRSRCVATLIQHDGRTDGRTCRETLYHSQGLLQGSWACSTGVRPENQCGLLSLEVMLRRAVKPDDDELESYNCYSCSCCIHIILCNLNNKQVATWDISIIANWIEPIKLNNARIDLIYFC